MRRAIILLQLLLALAFLGGLAMQLWGLPAMSVQVAAEEPGVAYLRVPCLVVAICFVVCLQIVLLACSALLLLTAYGRLLRHPAALLVDVGIDAIVIAGALCLGLGLWIKARTGGWSPPAFDLCVLAGLCLGAAVLVGVARVFLGRAIAQRATDGDSASSPAFPAAR